MAQNTNQELESNLLDQYRDFFKAFASIKDGKLTIDVDSVELSSHVILQNIPELNDIVGAYDFE
jgi:hypothetical protein